MFERTENWLRNRVEEPFNNAVKGTKFEQVLDIVGAPAISAAKCGKKLRNALTRDNRPV